MTDTSFRRPPKASHHCRHYSYDIAAFRRGEDGAQCAAGVDMRDGGEELHVLPCMPDPLGWCPKREEYSEAERDEWRAWRAAGMERLAKAVAALPAPIPMRSSGSVACPNCGGRLAYARWEGGAQIACATEGCCAARFNLSGVDEWPSPKLEGGAP